MLTATRQHATLRQAAVGMASGSSCIVKCSQKAASSSKLTSPPFSKADMNLPLHHTHVVPHMHHTQRRNPRNIPKAQDDKRRTRSTDNVPLRARALTKRQRLREASSRKARQEQRFAQQLFAVACTGAFVQMREHVPPAPVCQHHPEGEGAETWGANGGRIGVCCAAGQLAPAQGPTQHPAQAHAPGLAPSSP